MNSNTKKQYAVETKIDGYYLELTFANEKFLAVDIRTLSDAIRHAATLHGIKQKLCDAAAISRDPATGRTATIDTKYDAVKEVFDRITASDGTWNKVREGGQSSSGGLLLAALVRMYAGRKTRDDLVTFLSTKTDTEKSALRKNKTVADIIEDIRRERRDAGDDDSINSESLLDELND
jgi:hypothetical protein